MFHIKKVTDKKNAKKKKETVVLDAKEAEDLKFAEYFEISKLLIENGAKSYYDDGDE